MKKTLFIILLLIVSIQLSAKDYCQHPIIKEKVNILKQSLPIAIDSATNMYNFMCLDSRYIYYVTVDLSQYTKAELQGMYNFNQKQANSFYKSTNKKIRVRYVIHSLDGSIIKIINNK